jgi:glycosyltransferase involved in cell wall biosynthesis
MREVKVSIIGSRGYPYVYGGYETFIKELIEANLEGVDYTIYCHRPLFKVRPKFIAKTRLYYLPAIQHKALNQLSNSFLAVVHAVFFARPDIILFVNTANGPLAILTRIFGIKTAMITDGLEWKRPKWQGFGATYFKWATKVGAKLIDVLIADSLAMREIFLKEFGRDSEFISYGAHIKNEDGEDVLKSHGLCSKDFYLIVGRMIPDNNVHLLIEGFLKSKTKRTLVVVGDAPFNDSYAAAIKSMRDERLVFTGYIKDQKLLAQLYHHSYVYFHGHEFGGTNPTLLKALAYGCAILAIDTVFNREVLDNGRYGVFFEKDADAFAQSVNEIDQSVDVVNHFKAIARERVLSAYQWPEVAQKYVELFRKMKYHGYKSKKVR